jgi:probable HAF family extracellular repeat protein
MGRIGRPRARPRSRRAALSNMSICTIFYLRPQSYANGVDVSGNIVGYATDNSGVNHAILWQPVH